nr:NADH dehydrogenase subunit 3 [Stomphastis sp.]UYL25746.1 NADH dehydrogenase subunit 3 [Stomphastis sp.]UYL25759.1 NADH dehydrogenase subunit 3 [Stomphastis sp.]UYL25772.1 NADH dehydrogenase subunit 3 [Stomphastis sp.]UYL25785.1 NADH dehydrogenase subunit 3 [Stomphastis sp.]
MLIMLMIFIFIMILSNILMMISLLISKKSFMDREKCSPFECGFDPKTFARIPFSLHFFLITVIFLIFDIEIALIFPFILTFKLINFFSWSFMMMFFLIILLLGLYHEWNQNMLNWTN